MAEGDVVRVRTRGEALKLQKTRDADFGWATGSNPFSDDKNDVVVIKNRDSPSDHNELVVLESSDHSEVEDWDDLDDDLHA